MSRYIDADALKKRYREVAFKDGMTEGVVRFLIETNIDSAPSVVPQAKEGEWSLTLNDDYRCTACGLITSSYKANYCPNCGAKMKGAE